MDVRYYRDPETDEPHIYGHGVTESEVEYVLRHAGEDLPARDGARQVLGQTNVGRYLRIIYVPDVDRDSVFVITAFTMMGKPLEAYKRRQRRRRKR